MSPSNDDHYDRGVVVKKNIGSYLVRLDDRLIRCSLSSRIFRQPVYSSDRSNSTNGVVFDGKVLYKGDPVSVGDWVKIEEVKNGPAGIVAIDARRNQLVRQDPAPGKHKFEQVIVANVDFVLPVFAAAQPTPKWGLLDRYLVSAEAARIPACIVITKTDLIKYSNKADKEEIQIIIDEYRRIGYEVFPTSAYTGDGLSELRNEIRGHLSALVGKSGVGKTALLNAIEPGLGLRVGIVSSGKTGKGRHTTTSPEMVPLEVGGDIIDTPGVREFGLYDLTAEDLAMCFPEMRPYIGKCRFGMGCRHDEEPGCSVRKAVMTEAISPRRYHSYMLLRNELQNER